MNECLDAGWLQSFFDGELTSDLMEQTARHIASCANCAEQVREIENEQAIFMTALEPELSAAVPTEALRARINSAISEPAPIFAVEKSSATRRPWFLSVAELFSFTPQRAIAFASIMVVITLGSIFAAVKLRNRNAVVAPLAETVARATATVPKVNPGTPETNPQKANPAPPIQISQRSSSHPNRARSSSALTNEDQIAGVRLMPGERGYLKTIAVLDDGLKNNGERAITPSTRVEYEQNLKLVDNAIAATRSKAKQSPRDPAATEPMFAAYQSKIDLLNTMNEQARLGRQ